MKISHSQIDSTFKYMLIGVALTSLAIGQPAFAATTWDAGGNSHWWYNTSNWSEDDAMLVPPMVDEDNDPNTDDLDVTDALINYIPGQGDEGGWDQGFGVVYDPANDPGFENNPTRFIAPYDLQTIWRLYMGRSPSGEENTGLAKLTIRGDLNVNQAWGDTRWQIGRSSGTPGVASNAIIIQEGGTVINNDGDIDLGSNDSNVVGTFGNGTYEYRAGTLVQGFDPDQFDAAKRFRLSAGGSTAVGGVGTFIMHNPGEESGGHVRIRSFQVAPFGGQNGFEPNGVTNGLGIVQFHVTSEGTRPIQVNELLLGNGQDTGVGDPGIRSSQLRIVLDAAPQVDAFGVPMDMGLFDVDWDGDGNGAIIGPGALGNTFGFTFSNADAPDPLHVSAVYDNLVDGRDLTGQADNIVTAMFGSSTYRWRIHYDGNIVWSDADNSILDTSVGRGYGIEGPGTGRDIVLIGLDSIIISDGVPGDYNGDGFVDAADYTVWRNNLGGDASALEPGSRDPMNGGVINADDYAFWKANYGMGMPPGAGGLAGSVVPEPGAMVLALFAAAGVFGIGRRGRAAA